jgi:hypothetical protein
MGVPHKQTLRNIHMCTHFEEKNSPWVLREEAASDSEHDLVDSEHDLVDFVEAHDAPQLLGGELTQRHRECVWGFLLKLKNRLEGPL